MFSRVSTAAIAAACILTGAAGAHAATTTTIIDFDGPAFADAPSGSGSSFVVGDYLLSNLNLQSGNCFSGDCTSEARQGTLLSVERVDGGAFDFGGFFFSSQGNGQFSGNFVQVDGLVGTMGNYAVQDSIDLAFGDTFASVQATEGATITYTQGETPQPGNPANKALCTTTQICMQYGYTATLGAGFEDVTKVMFSSFPSANNRIDQLVLTSDMAPVPLPAAGYLLLAGLFGFGAMGRRKAATA